jgi:uncharacterized membrane protein
MSSFLWGALGAAAVLSLAVLGRRAAWRRVHRTPYGARHLLHHIGATPEQERAVLAETDALAAALRGLREDARALRADLADLLAAPALEPGRVSAAFDARLARSAELRAQLAEGVARIHAALGAEQRARLAELVRSGPRRGCRHGMAHA